MLKVVIVLVFGACVAATWTADEDGAEVHRLILEADAMLWLGIAENGRARDFSVALELVNTANELLATAEIPDTTQTKHTRQIEALKEDLTFNLERSQQRFYGIYPLARVAVPVVALAEQEDITETLHPDAAIEAVRRAAERVVVDIIRLQHPHVVFRSEPRNRAFENEAMRVFANANRPFAHDRAELVGALSAADLAAFDRGDINADVTNRLLAAVGATELLVLTVIENVDLPDVTLVLLEGVTYAAGSSEPTDSFTHRGFLRDRRDQVAWMVVGQLVLFAAALVLAAATPWSLKTPWPVVQRIAMGAALFIVGRIFASLAVMALRGVIPSPDAAQTVVWWWPALLGLLSIVGSGFVAWLAQAKVSRIVPGTRTSRAVGMTFVLAALGASAYFIEPLLLLEPDRAFAVFVPFVLASAALALLTGYAIRTGPPVPTYFVLGPVAVAPLVGLALFTLSTCQLWWTVVASAALWAMAFARRQYAITHDLEEVEPDEDDAERADLERLERVSKNVEKKLPI